MASMIASTTTPPFSHVAASHNTRLLQYHPLTTNTIAFNSTNRFQTGAYWTRSTNNKTDTSPSKTALSRPRFPITASSSFNISPPPIDHDFLETVAVEGAKVSEGGVIETFDNDDEALEVCNNGVVVADLSHFGRIRVSGDDRIHFLHNQSTSNFDCLHEGQGCDTVFVSPTARTIDIAHAWIMKSSILLVVAPETCGTIAQMLNKYIFFADNVEIEDITKKTCFFVLVGPHCDKVVKDLNLGDLVGQSYGTNRHYSVNGMPVTVGVGNLISEKGYSLLMSPAIAGYVWKSLLSSGAVPLGSDAWERLRVIEGGESFSSFVCTFCYWFQFLVFAHLLACSWQWFLTACMVTAWLIIVPNAKFWSVIHYCKFYSSFSEIWVFKMEEVLWSMGLMCWQCVYSMRLSEVDLL